MRATLKQMRASVKGWLIEEGSTKEQALTLLDVLYAGAISGSEYQGSREDVTTLMTTRRPSRLPWEEEAAYKGDEDSTFPECGCLVHVMEMINGVLGDDVRDIKGATAEAFVLANKIPLGATPFNDPWARAAAQGIEDYIAFLALLDMAPVSWRATVL